MVLNVVGSSPTSHPSDNHSFHSDACADIESVQVFSLNHLPLSCFSPFPLPPPSLPPPFSLFPFPLFPFSPFPFSFSLFPIFSFLISVLLFPLFSEIQFFSSPLFFFFFFSLSRLHIPITVPAVSPAGPPSLSRARAHSLFYIIAHFPRSFPRRYYPSFFRPPRPQFPPLAALICLFAARKQLFSYVFSKNLRKYLVEWKSRRTFAPANEKGTPLRRRGCDLRSLRGPRLRHEIFERLANKTE